MSTGVVFHSRYTNQRQTARPQTARDGKSGASARSKTDVPLESARPPLEIFFPHRKTKQGPCPSQRPPDAARVVSFCCEMLNAKLCVLFVFVALLSHAGGKSQVGRLEIKSNAAVGNSRYQRRLREVFDSELAIRCFSTCQDEPSRRKTSLPGGRAPWKSQIRGKMP